MNWKKKNVEQESIAIISIGAVGTVNKVLVQRLEDLEIRGRVETIQTTALLRSARIPRRAWRLEETCCHLNSTERQSTNTDVKKSQSVKQ